MAKIKKFPAISIKRITGGRDPERIIEEFIARLGFNPTEAQREKNSDAARWMLSLEGGQELEILLEGRKKPNETTIYMGVNLCIVPIRGSTDFLAAALEIADGLVGIKVSLVGHFLVLSASVGAADIDVDDLEYNFKLVVAQIPWFRDALQDELGIEESS